MPFPFRSPGLISPIPTLPGLLSLSSLLSSNSCQTARCLHAKGSASKWREWSVIERRWFGQKAFVFILLALRFTVSQTSWDSGDCIRCGFRGLPRSLKTEQDKFRDVCYSGDALLLETIENFFYYSADGFGESWCGGWEPWDFVWCVI